MENDDSLKKMLASLMGGLSGVRLPPQAVDQMQVALNPKGSQPAALQQPPAVMPAAPPQPPAAPPFAEPPLMMPGFGGNMAGGQGGMPPAADWRTTMMQSVFGSPASAGGAPALGARGAGFPGQMGPMDRQSFLERISQMQNRGRRSGGMPPFGLGG